MSRPTVRQKGELSVSPTNAMVEGHSNRGQWRTSGVLSCRPGAR
jgi:hypothetical protein